jgi:hypothetical protein
MLGSKCVYLKKIRAEMTGERRVAFRNLNEQTVSTARQKALLAQKIEN